MRVSGGMFCGEVISNSCVLGPGLCSVIDIPSSIGCWMSGLTKEGVPVQRFPPQPATPGQVPAAPNLIPAPCFGDDKITRDQ